MSFLRSFLFSIPVVAIWTMAMEMLALVVSFFDKRGEWQHRIARLWAKIMLPLCFVRVRVEGVEKIDKNGTYVFVSNHQSYLDIPTLVALIPQQFRFFYKKELLTNPLWGIYLKRAKHVVVDQSDRRAAVKSIAVGVKLVTEDRVSVLVFPEGSRSGEGLLDFEEGAAYIAIKAGVPVIPIAITGMWRLLPTGSLSIRSGTGTVRIGDAISTAGLKHSDRAEFTRRLHAEISRLAGME
ncbi:MAG: 1-acyl-sn-glycerol-3-phosphate acyltransferase [Acidobacteriota bacterium]|nr:1-acyl-sn-glycerol-3-phosphate acyltransferase [Acidobacteriota bacterium]